MLPFRGANCAVVSQPLFSLDLQIQLGIVLPQRALNDRIFGHGFDGFVESLGQLLNLARSYLVLRQFVKVVKIQLSRIKFLDPPCQHEQLHRRG